MLSKLWFIRSRFFTVQEKYFHLGNHPLSTHDVTFSSHYNVHQLSRFFSWTMFSQSCLIKDRGVVVVTGLVCHFVQTPTDLHVSSAKDLELAFHFLSGFREGVHG